jgi:hypothetical protein
MKLRVTKGLIIDEPWISKILNGEKIWEMRSKHTAQRGHFALIRKGSGQVVGIANLKTVSGPYTEASLEENACKHCVGAELYSRPDYKWWYAWELGDIQPLQHPVPYVHKNGAVTWVTLNQAAQEGIQHQLNACADRAVDVSATAISVSQSEIPIKDKGNEVVEMSNKESQEPGVTEKTAVNSACGNRELLITLTQGNINNNHFYIPRNTKLFAESVWGGKNKQELGSQVEWHFKGLDYAVNSDIDGSKRILRNRSAVKAFYKLHKASAGEELRIRRSDVGNYSVSLNR